MMPPPCVKAADSECGGITAVLVSPRWDTGASTGFSLAPAHPGEQQVEQGSSCCQQRALCTSQGESLKRDLLTAVVRSAGPWELPAQQGRMLLSAPSKPREHHASADDTSAEQLLSCCYVWSKPGRFANLLSTSPSITVSLGKGNVSSAPACPRLGGCAAEVWHRMLYWLSSDACRPQGLKIALVGVKRWQCPEIHAALQGSQPRYHPAWAEGPSVMNTWERDDKGLKGCP